ncbi:aspartic peptidase domain-containing protein [Cercophora newfieldiana]|uniref:Aspartic peptidase domain-containing protein n=1 Tax=Cercophora newfieldiana TaxID=92897 RepID=A0AA40CHZ5_9PEZI|nr:aspartic peptidase domain-containing protein [Cercophora newfieldiana]
MARLSFCVVVALATSLCGLAGAAPVDEPYVVKTVRNPNYKVDGRAEYAKALSKWGVKLPNGLAQHVSSKPQVGTVSAETQGGDREYLTPIGIGTPPQTILLDLDTGSADFWVYSSETNPDILGNRSRWDPKSSTTAQPIPNSSWSIQYGDGSTARGHAWKDTISVGGINIPNAVVESALSVSDSMATDAEMGGIFGLAIGLGSEVYPVQPTVLKKLSPLLKHKVFAADLQYHADGTYQFGAVDGNKFKGNLHWTPLIDDAQYWQFNFSVFNIQGSDIWYWYNWSGIADTGSTLLMLDDDVVAFYYDGVEGAAYNKSYGLWTYPCDTKLPDFHLGLGDGHGNWTARIPGRYLNYTVYETEGWECMGGLQGNAGASFSIFGDVFLKAFYAVFDIGGKRVGFADKHLN